MAEPLRATFFTLQHRDRAVLLPATLVMIVIVAVLVAALVAINWPGIARLFQVIQEGTSGQKTPQEQLGLLFASFFTLIGSIFLFLIPFFIVLAAYEAACLRWMIRGEAPGLFGLTFNYDTWRIYGIYWCWTIAKFVIGFVASMLTMPLMFGTIGQVMTTSKPDPDALLHWQLMVQLPMMLLQYIPLIFIGIRLGPAAATSVARDRFSFFEAWQVTKGRFLSLFGSWALLWGILAILYVAIFAATWGLLFQDTWRDWFSHWPAPPSEGAIRDVFNRVFSQQGLTIYALSALANAALVLAYVLFGYGINARAALAALEEGKIQRQPPSP